MEDAMMRVLHRTSEWLPGTMTWLRQLIHDTDPMVRNVILTERILANSPGHPGLRSARQESPVRHLVSRVLKKTGLLRFNGADVALAASVRPDILHSHFGHIGAQDVALAAHLNVPHIVSFYGMDVHQLPYSDARWFPMYREMFASGVQILCEGAFMRESIIALGASPDQVHVHRLGVDVGRIRFHPRRVAPGESLHVLMASAFRPKKGIPYGIEAVAKAAASIPIRLTIVGDAADDASQDEKQRIEALLATTDIGSPIRRVGFVSAAELQALSEDHHVYLAPSVTAADGDCEGGAPVSLIEAGASGMVVVSTRHCDIPGVIEHGRTGWLSEERDTDAMATNLIRVWESRDDWEPSQIALRQHIETSFHHRIQADALLRVYERVGGQP
jgi:colanic acid/amylovoran biosynthesis glycosyltransferase